MGKPILVVMAAGMGSRYGGCKQIDPVGSHGEVMMDYSIFDAKRAGFERVVFIIKDEIEADFRALVGNRIDKVMDTAYAFQRLDDLPADFAVPAGRTKPWGTSHAIYCARDVIDSPFAVINADDYYGPEAFQRMYDYLTALPADGAVHPFSMVGYQLKNTLTENGHVSRGVCTAVDGFLQTVTERAMIQKTPAGAAYSDDGGATWTPIDPDTVVSMNLWGFTPAMLEEISARFPRFLTETVPHNPLKAEYLLPHTVQELLSEGKATVRVLTSGDTWCGVTYKEDKPQVVATIAQKHADGLYPTPLWGAAL